MSPDWQPPGNWVVPFKRTLSVHAYRANVLPLVRHPDGRLFFSNAVNLQTMDRDAANPVQLWTSSGTEYAGYSVYQALLLPSGTMLLRLTNFSGGNAILRSTDLTYTAFETVASNLGGELLHRGWSAAPDGTVLLGEYPTGNAATVKLWRADNDGRDWTVIHTFGGRGATVPEVFHIHTVCYDPFDGLWWINTGDNDPECRIYTSDGTTLTLIGSGSQHYRAVSFAFDDNYALWALDGTIGGAARFMRYDKNTGALLIGAEPLTGQYMFITERLDCPVTLYFADGHQRFVSNTAWLSHDGRSWYEAFTWQAQPEAIPYPAFNGFMDGGDGRLFAFTTSLYRHDTGEPFNNGTIVLDIT